jgi:hypothetical protein
MFRSLLAACALLGSVPAGFALSGAEKPASSTLPQAESKEAPARAVLPKADSRTAPDAPVAVVPKPVEVGIIGPQLSARGSGCGFIEVLPVRPEVDPRIVREGAPPDPGKVSLYKAPPPCRGAR